MKRLENKKGKRRRIQTQKGVINKDKQKQGHCNCKNIFIEKMFRKIQVNKVSYS